MIEFVVQLTISALVGIAGASIVHILQSAYCLLRDGYNKIDIQVVVGLLMYDAVLVSIFLFVLSKGVQR